MSYNPDMGITFDDVKMYNGEELDKFIRLIEFNLSIQRNRDATIQLFSNKQFSKGYRRLKMWLDLAYKTPPVYIDENDKQEIVKSLNIPYSESKIYALAGLMVIFQVFGDGNHRTANEYFKSYTGKSLTEKQMNYINDVMNMRGNDFYQIATNRYPPARIDEIVHILMSKYQSLGSSQMIIDDGSGAGAGATPEIMRELEQRNISSMKRKQPGNDITSRKRYGGKTKRKNKSGKSKNKKYIKNKKTKKNKLRKLNPKGGKSKTCWDPKIISPAFFGYPLKK